MPTITTEHLNKYYVDKKTSTAVAALYDVNVTFPDGKFSVIMGSSGSGKTTLLKTLIGLYPADEGRIFFDGRDVTDLAVQKRNVSFISQEYALYPHLTVFDNVAYPLKIAKVPVEEMRLRVEKILESLAISLLSSRKIRSLSGGQAQRVALARALVKEPDVVFLDEPLSNLDAPARAAAADEIKRIATTTKTTFIYVTHNNDEARRLADYVVVMENGTVKRAEDAESYFSVFGNR